MEYTIGFKINESIKSYTLHTLVLTPDKKIGIIDYEPNRNADKVKVRMSINIEGEYNTYEKSALTVVIPFILDSDCKEYTIKSIDNYHIFKNKNERFKGNEIEIKNDSVVYLTNNKNYENPTLEQCVLHLEEKYRFSSTFEAYAVNVVLAELYKLKYGIEK